MPKAKSLESTAHSPQATAQGWQGWDDYADFYDWENAQTLDRRDVKFWQAMARRAKRSHPRARVRHRTRHDSGGANGRTYYRRRSIVRHAQPCAEAIETRAGGRPACVAARRHPVSSLPRVGAIRSRHGAVWHPPVARQRIRSEGDARVGRARAGARRHLRRRSRARSAGVEGIPQQSPLSRSRAAAGSRVSRWWNQCGRIARRS